MDPLNKASLFYQNVRGLRTKIGEFSDNILISTYDIICLTETWLNPDFPNHCYFPQIFSVYRKDRNEFTSSGTRGGGVLIALNSNTLLMTKEVLSLQVVCS